MTDVQLYLAIGIPSAFFAVNLLVIIWQARGITQALGGRIDSLEKVMTVNFAMVDVKLLALDHRMDQNFQALNTKIDQNFEIQRQMLLRVEGVMDVRVKHLEEREH
jgi:hypothetical protein